MEKRAFLDSALGIGDQAVSELEWTLEGKPGSTS